jgi:hypothetical protein
MSDDLYSGDESSGLLTHFVGRVRTGFWSNFFAETEGKATADYAHDTLWFAHVDVLDVLQENYETSGAPVESVQVSLGIGKGWHVDPNNPNLIEHEDDTPDYQKKIRADSAYMRFVYIVGGKNSTYENAIVLDGDGPFECDLTGVRAVHAQRGVTTMKDATVWDNLVFEYRGLGFKYRSDDKPRARAYPVRYLGYDDSEVPDISKLNGSVGSVSGNSTPNSASGPRAALGTVPPEVVNEWTTAGASGPTVATLTRLWDSSPTVEHFIGNAGMLPDVKANEALAKAVIDTPDPAVSQ